MAKKNTDHFFIFFFVLRESCLMIIWWHLNFHSFSPYGVKVKLHFLPQTKLWPRVTRGFFVNWRMNLFYLSTVENIQKSGLEPNLNLGLESGGFIAGRLGPQSYPRRLPAGTQLVGSTKVPRKHIDKIACKKYTNLSYPNWHNNILQKRENKKLTLNSFQIDSRE